MPLRHPWLSWSTKVWVNYRGRRAIFHQDQSAGDGRQTKIFSESAGQVDWVQLDQIEIIRYLIRRHAVRAVFSEGVSKESMAGLTVRLDVLRDMTTLEHLGKLDASELRKQKEITLTVGAVGRLLLAKEIDHVLPLEDEAALQDAKSVAGRKIAPDDAKVQARRRAMVRNLPTSGLAVVILGPHDLGPYLPAGTLYVRVTPRSYSE
jgi:hypothetical protein